MEPNQPRMAPPCKPKQSTPSHQIAPTRLNPIRPARTVQTTTIPRLHKPKILNKKRLDTTPHLVYNPHTQSQ